MRRRPFLVFSFVLTLMLIAPPFSFAKPMNAGPPPSQFPELGFKASMPSVVTYVYDDRNRLRVRKFYSKEKIKTKSGLEVPKYEKRVYSIVELGYDRSDDKFKEFAEYIVLVELIQTQRDKREPLADVYLLVSSPWSFSEKKKELWQRHRISSFSIEMVYYMAGETEGFGIGAWRIIIRNLWGQEAGLRTIPLYYSEE